VKVASIDTVVVNVPYDRRELSYQVARDGVTSVLVKVVTDDGVVGWGEACSGADVVSMKAAVEAMKPFVLGRDPWQRERMRADLWHHGLWQFRPMTASFAWVGLDMALWDLVGRATGLPLHKLLGGARRDRVDYFYYLARGAADDLRRQCEHGRTAGFSVFYLKVGLDFAADLAMVATVREALGPGPKLRVDANGAWSVAEARQRISALADYDIDLVEQPVKEYPLELMAEVRRTTPTAIAANEGLWTEADLIDRLLARTADVVCFSPYWVGSLVRFQRLGSLASSLGVQVCKHTHGELGLAAAAAHHVLLTLPSIVDGNQQTATHMVGDIVDPLIPIASEPSWGVPLEPGLGVQVDEDAVAEAADRYAADGQYLPYQLDQLAATWES
jgi:L-Ala-D/L-Glu epimerase